MAGNDFVIASGKVGDIKGILSEIEKKRMKYIEGYTLEELIDAPVTFDGVSMSNMIVSKEGNIFGYLEFYNDIYEEKLKIGINFRFKSNKPRIYSGSKLFPLIQAMVGDMEAEYFEIDYKKFQEKLRSIKSLTVEGVEIDGEYAYVVPKVTDIIYK